MLCMKEYFKLKTWLILGAMLIIGVGLAFFIVILEFRENKGTVRAGIVDNVSGYAWSENIGWISFNCSNDSSCGTVDYGVNVNRVTGNFSGYAWSPNIGWISFNRSDTGSPPRPPYNGAETIIANYDIPTGLVNGWAKILSLGDDGWLKLRKYSSDTGSDYGLSLDVVTNEFSGWAWNGSDSGGYICRGGTQDNFSCTPPGTSCVAGGGTCVPIVGIGWVSFNCADSGAGGCSGHDYKVFGKLSVEPQVINLSAPNWNYDQACSLYARQAFLRWEFSDPDAGDYQSAYQIIFDDDVNPADPLIDTGKVSGSVNQYSINFSQLDYDKTYYWWVKVWDNFNVASVLTAGQSFTTYKHEFPDINFAWIPLNPSKDEEVKFSYSSVVYGGATVSNLLWTATNASIDDPATSTPTIIFSASGSQTATLKVTDSDGYYCSLTQTINLNVNLPGWKEVKPK